MGGGVIKAAAARFIGRSHISTDCPCQDDVAIVRSNGNVSIALADGAGSKKNSDIGAKIASKQAAKVALEFFDQIFFLANKGTALDTSHAASLVLNPVLAALQRKSKSQKEPLDSLASTLLFVACKDGRYVAGHIGDGVIGIRQDAQIKTLSSPENGEFANSTWFITDQNALLNFRIYAGIANTGFGAILMSDGTAESLYEKSTGQLAAATQRFFDWSDRLSLKKMEAVLLANLQQVFSQKTIDDCSIGIITLQ